ncbi:MAG: pyrroline-5-carboxylate reductase [Xanthomonadales bacterium]|nr:Pyrroline-5-carboxylate reductase [Xanthomonadales bacterium]MCC6593748.1 pyrroline-5-carboxylate reductase [Xanthomonadales bacterium]MCE7932483.1 pyrroline-5-carboxylate reductase [Xanthomonadales bacterium PRO6]
MSRPIAFIGGGNMARSLIGGLIRQGHAGHQIHVSEPNADLRETLARDFGVVAHALNDAAARLADIWVLAVKPQVMATVLAELAPVAVDQAPLVVSIAAGVTHGRIADVLGPGARVVRTMPNTPAMIGAGITGLYAGADVGAAERVAVEALFASAGATVWIADEMQMDAVTAVSGSGPAYFFLLIEALVAAGARQGLPTDTAARLALHTALGAARMVIESGEEVALLRQRVTSPGGTTAAALDVFVQGGFPELVDQAVAAATRRGRELTQCVG